MAKAKSNVGILAVLGIGLIVLVVFGGTIIAFGTTLINSGSSFLANFFKGLGQDLGLNSTEPTPTPVITDNGGNPTPTPTSTPLPTAVGTSHITLAINVPNTNPASNYVTILWTDSTSGISGAISPGANPNGGSFTCNNGDLLSFKGLGSGTFKFDHFIVSNGGSSNTNPLKFNIDGDFTITAYFIEFVPGG
jgi:hypothetical protein